MTKQAKYYIVCWYQKNSCDALDCNGCKYPLISQVTKEKGEPLLFCRSCGYRKLLSPIEFWTMWKDFVSFFMYKDSILSKVLIFWAMVYLAFMTTVGSLAVMTVSNTINGLALVFLISLGLMLIFIKKAITMWSLFEALRQEENRSHPSR